MPVNLDAATAALAAENFTHTEKPDFLTPTSPNKTHTFRKNLFGDWYALGEFGGVASPFEYVSVKLQLPKTSSNHYVGPHHRIFTDDALRHIQAIDAALFHRATDPDSLKCKECGDYLCVNSPRNYPPFLSCWWLRKGRCDGKSLEPPFNDYR